MTIASQIAKHFREVHYGGNWTASNLTETLKGISWQQATTKIYGLNTIATLVYHIHYYVLAALDVLQGKKLNAKDEYSFAHPPIQCQKDWDDFVHKVFEEVNLFSTLIEQVSDEKLSETFEDEKYGNYYRNLQGIIEHTHYHLGQIALIKKILSQQAN